LLATALRHINDHLYGVGVVRQAVEARPATLRRAHAARLEMLPVSSSRAANHHRRDPDRVPAPSFPRRPIVLNEASPTTGRSSTSWA